jgi:hypothetical protein
LGKKEIAAKYGVWHVEMLNKEKWGLEMKLLISDLGIMTLKIQWMISV